jgi:hypothetical protein
VPQHHPEVDERDVERILARDYAGAELGEMREMIRVLEVREKWRIVVACLKNGAGDVAKLRGELHNASGWWREIISEAEYPLATKRMFRMDKLSPDEQQAIYDKDWRQYEEWLRRA